MSLVCSLAAFAALVGSNVLPADTKFYSHGENQPFCVERNGVSFCFAPGTPADYVRKMIARLPPIPAGQITPQYQIGGRWSTTASGGTGTRGNPTTLTYSFAPDGTAMPGAAGEPATPSNLTSQFNTAFTSLGGEATWKAKIRTALTGWSNFGALTYVEVTDDGASLPGNNGRNSAPTRGDVRISGHTIDGAGRILAYNYFPNFGDMVLDTADTVNFARTANDYRFLRNTIAHEHGHGLGFDHSDPIIGTKLMEAFLNTGFDGQQDDDIRAVQRNYGDRSENNDSSATATNLGTINGLRTVPNLSTDSSTDVDWFTLPVSANSALTVRVIPVGSTYNIGPQGGTTVSVDTLRINNLSFDVYAANGTTLLTSRNVAGKGDAEVLTNFVPSGANGQVYLRTYNTGTIVNDVQRYRLEVEINESSLSGSVTMQGCLNRSQEMTFDFRVGGVSQFTRTVTLDSSGSFAINNIPPDNYIVSVKGAKWLRKNVAVDLTNGDFNGFTVILLAGDADDDNRVDINDLLALISVYNTSVPGGGFTDPVDFNCDALYDINDLLFLIANYNTLGDE